MFFKGPRNKENGIAAHKIWVEKNAFAPGKVKWFYFLRNVDSRNISKML